MGNATCPKDNKKKWWQQLKLKQQPENSTHYQSKKNVYNWYEQLTENHCLCDNLKKKKRITCKDRASEMGTTSTPAFWKGVTECNFFETDLTKAIDGTS